MLYRYDYCQLANQTSQYFTNIKGTCGDSEELNLPAAPSKYNCSDKFLSNYKMEWLTFLPCVYKFPNCGSKSQQIYLNGEDSRFTLEASNLELGDVCMYEILYNGTDSQQKINIDSVSNAEITLIDGIRIHPWLDPKVLNETHILLSMSAGDEFELGDSWYNYTSVGRAYLFIKSTDAGGKATLSLGFKPLFPKWVSYVSAAAGGVVVLGCLFICCCIVRRQAAKKAEEGNKVKKFAQKDDVQLSKFKYGRESRPVNLPELAEIEDEMQKPEDDDYKEGDEDD